MADFAVQAKQLEMRQAAAKRELDRIAATKKQLGKEKAEIDSKAAEAKELLGTLKDRAARRQPLQPSAPARAAAPCQRRPPPAAPAPPCSTPWPRSATPTSTAPPARAPSTAPA